MAIKKVAILITIDTSEKEEPSGTTRVDLRKPEKQVPGADETYYVFVNDSWNPGPEGKPNKERMLDSCAHEIGHVLSSAFKVKGGMHEDPRAKGEFVDFLKASYATGEFLLPKLASDDQKRRVFQNENMAWQIAEKIRPELNKESAAEALATYEWANVDKQN